ncbi:hypothetical protein evm_010886 [Chilo suppressalis]|nr:hypothetical protein evm_010886 [Chilo suppressalis]
MKLHILLALTIAIYKSCAIKLKCDYEFGSQNWNYAKVFFVETFTMPVGLANLDVNIPNTPGQMTSFVCVNVTGAPTHDTRVSFASLFHKLNIALKKRLRNPVSVLVVAKGKGF